MVIGEVIGYFFEGLVDLHFATAHHLYLHFVDLQILFCVPYVWTPCMHSGSGKTDTGQNLFSTQCALM